MSWFQRNNLNGEPGVQNNEPPLEVDLTKHLDNIADKVVEKIKGTQPDINEAINANPTIMKIAAAFENSERQRQQRLQQQQNQQTQQQEATFEQAYNEMDENTRTVVDARFNLLQEQSLRNGARETRRSVFEDIEGFPYYTGEIKTKVDEMLDKEPLQAQNNPLVVRNAYKVVLADHLTELQQNKLKSRLSSATGSSNAAGLSTPDPNRLPELSAEEKKYADFMGIKQEDWAKQKKELIEQGEITSV